MSLSSLMSLDRMTVRTPHLALGDFRLCLSKALCEAHIKRLVAEMVEVKRVRVGLVPAVHASGSDLESIEPASDGCGALIRNSVHMRSISRPFKPGGSPLFHFLLWNWRTDARSVLAQSRTELRRSFCSKCATALPAFKQRLFNSLPRFHLSILPDIYPCKPDIFAATYEPVESDATP